MSQPSIAGGAGARARADSVGVTSSSERGTRSTTPSRRSSQDATKGTSTPPSMTSGLRPRRRCVLPSYFGRCRSSRSPACWRGVLATPSETGNRRGSDRRSRPRRRTFPLQTFPRSAALPGAAHAARGRREPRKTAARKRSGSRRSSSAASLMRRVLRPMSVAGLGLSPRFKPPQRRDIRAIERAREAIEPLVQRMLSRSGTQSPLPKERSRVPDALQRPRHSGHVRRQSARHIRADRLRNTEPRPVAARQHAGARRRIRRRGGIHRIAPHPGPGKPVDATRADQPGPVRAKITDPKIVEQDDHDVRPPPSPTTMPGRRTCGRPQHPCGARRAGRQKGPPIQATTTHRPVR